MKYLLLGLWFISTSLLAQQLSYPLPRDARNEVLYFGVGNPIATEVTGINVTAYNTSVRWEVPDAGDKRVYRHLFVLNRSSARTVYVCFGTSTGCSGDSYILRPEYGLVFEPLRFGAPVGTTHLYFRLDSAGTADVDVSVW